MAFGREDDANRQRQSRAKVRDIGRIPAPADLTRRKRATKKLGVFLRRYFPEAFYLGFSDTHFQVIDRMQEAIEVGGLFAYAMPRGSGKTTICVRAAMWAILTGRRRWVCMIGATADHAEKLLEEIKTLLRFNQLLAEDFPEACVPIQALEGETRRCAGQTVEGQPTNVDVKKGRLRLAQLSGDQCDGGGQVPCSGAVVTCVGITGNIRGQVETDDQGSVKRPDFIIVDDPQTRESAGSTKQNQDRAATLNGDILGLSGPDIRISGFMPCTVIRADDIADRILDREQSPQWHGVKSRMVDAWPTNQKLWDEYADIWREEHRAGGDGSQANQFYLDHRAEMDAGGAVSWEDRFIRDQEHSAIQHAWNLRLRNESAFFAEYQNEPVDDAEMAFQLLTRKELKSKTHRFGRREVPDTVLWRTCYVDVQGHSLWWMHVGWDRSFTGYVLDYGTWPKARSLYPSLDDYKGGGGLPGKTIENRVSQGLASLWKYFSEFPYRLDSAAVDSQWGPSTASVYAFIQSNRENIYASHGIGITATNKPMSTWKVQKGERAGVDWRLRRRDLHHDANAWKTFVWQRLKQEGMSSIQWFHGREDEHACLADHLLAELPTEVEAKGRRIYQWEHRSGKPDNHWFDCLVGCAVQASVLGAKLPSHKDTRPMKKRARNGSKAPRGVSYI